MEIRPAGSGKTPYAGSTGSAKPRGTDAASPGAPVNRKPTDAVDAGNARGGADQITISDEGRRLLEASEASAAAATSGSGELSPDRLKTILDRIAGGWYDQGQVQGEVLNQIAADLEAGTPTPPAA